MNKMYRMNRMSLIATALILGGGVLSSANAEQPAAGPPIYTADAPPSYQEPASLLPPNPDARYVSSELTPSPSQSPAATPGTPSSRLVQARTDQGVRYISGGVGEGDRTELNSLSDQFNLRLLFAMQGSGEYLSAVRVNILDKQGSSVLNVESKGPWLLAQLEPGDYIVEASATDQGQPLAHRQTAHIEGSGQSRLDFYWR